MTARDDRLARWERLFAWLLDGPGMGGQDALTLCEIRGSVERLLEYQAVLPAGLVVMLRDYLPELADRTDGRWDGMRASSQALRLCEHIAWDIAAGDLKPGDRVSFGRDDCYPLLPPVIVYRAMQVLAARGEVTRREDGFYVRTPDGDARCADRWGIARWKRPRTSMATCSPKTRCRSSRR